MIMPKALMHATRTGVPLLFLLVPIVVLSRYDASGVLSPDFYTHLLHGEWIIKNLALPSSDFYTWTRSGDSYVLSQWMSEAILAAAWLMYGGWGTKMLAAIAAITTLVLVHKASRAGIDDRSAAAVTAVVMCGWVVVPMTAGPAMFSIALFAATVFLTARWKERQQNIYLYALPPLFVVWANLDPGYVFGLAYLAFVLVGLVAEHYVIRAKDWMHSIAGPLAIASIIALAGTLLTPYGLSSWTTIARADGAASLIPGLSAPTLDSSEGILLLLGICATVAAAGFSRRRMRLEEFVLFVLFMMIGAAAKDNLPFFLIVATPIVARHAAETPFADVMLPALTRDMSFASQGLVALLLFPMAISASIALRAQGETQFRQQFSVEAMRFVIASGLTNKIMHPPHVGGYFAYSGGLKIFADARPQLFDKSFMRELTTTQEARPGYRELISKWAPETIVAPLTSAMPGALIATGDYAKVYESKTDVVLLKRNARHDPFIAATEKTALLGTPHARN